MFVPFRWNSFCAPPNVDQIGFFRVGESRLKRLPARNVGIDAVTGIHAAQWRIWKVPLLRIHAVSLVDEQHLKITRSGLACEDRLPAVAVRQPFVQNQTARELIDVLYAREQILRQVIKYLPGIKRRIAGVERSELEAAAAARCGPAYVHAKFTRVSDEPIRYLDDCNARHGETEPYPKPG